MTTLREHLTTGDPVRLEPGLSSLEIDTMRRRVVQAATSHRAGTWTITMTLALALVVVVGLGVTVTRATWDLATPRLPSPARTSTAHPSRRQLQIETPGGTRVIWVFNPDLELR
jgi:hypothetical protein